MALAYWAIKNSSGWAVKKEGASRPASVHPTQTEAWAETRRLARGVGGNAYLKDQDGRIRAQNSYKDFPPSKRG